MFVNLLKKLILCTLLIASPVWAQHQLVQLKLSGKIALPAAEQPLIINLEFLSQLKSQQVQTHNPWFQGLNTFSGPSLQSLALAVGAEDFDYIKVSSMNNFSALIPKADIDNYNLILAFKVNDKLLKVRELGPLFLVYSFDKYPNLKTELYYNRSVWQINQIEFL